MESNAGAVGRAPIQCGCKRNLVARAWGGLLVGGGGVQSPVRPGGARPVLAGLLQTPTRPLENASLSERDCAVIAAPRFRAAHDHVLFELYRALASRAVPHALYRGTAVVENFKYVWLGF